MAPENRDLALLWDMREAAREILEFTKEAPFSYFASNKMLRYAVERQILVIGEAASRISEDFRRAHPEIPWRGIIGQRHVLAHEYGEILVERIWLVVTQRIPELLQWIEPLIPLSPENNDGGNISVID